MNDIGHSRVVIFGRMIKFSHSIFALPFALAMYVLVVGERGLRLQELIWIILAVVSARTAAMSWNRLVDRDMDGVNPRTQHREIPIGLLSPAVAWAAVLVSSLVFVWSAAMLGPHCLVLSPLVLIVLLGYSFAKRFTSGCHYWLGVALALAPGGVWYALTGEWSVRPIALMMAVLCWVAGFDIVYATQDTEFDRAHGVHSLPSKRGISSALHIARILHILAIGFLVMNGYVFHLGVVYYVGVLVFGLVLWSQHRMVHAGDLSKVNIAFFERNGLASIVFFIFTLGDALFPDFAGVFLT